MRELFRRGRRVVLSTLLVLTIVTLVGATYQGAATALDRRRYQHPGRLVDVGGHQLHIDCSGEGRATVVLEAPAAGLSAAWGGLQQALAGRARVCSYDRTGLGWSERGDARYDPLAVPGELHRLLARTGEHAPYVLVGQGLGAAFAQLFAAEFPQETAALVLIDPPRTGAGEQALQTLRAAPWLARTGLLRATRWLSRNADGLPPPSRGAMAAFLNRPDHLTRSAIELRDWDRAVAAAEAAALEPGMRVVRLDAAGSGPLALLATGAQVRAAAEAVRDALAPPRR